MVSLGQEIAANGWCAGCVVSHGDVAALTPHLGLPKQKPANVLAEDWLVVSSQTCDVVAMKLAQEPFVEVLHCQPVPKLRAEFGGLRSTRRIDLKPNKETHPVLVLTAHAAANRYPLPRELFRDISPDPLRRLSKNSILRLAEWDSLRSRRPAWPDAFVSRVAPAKRELEHALEPLADDIEVRIAIRERDEDLPEGGSYHVVVHLILDDVVWREDTNRREAAHRAYCDFVAILRRCVGVVVDDGLSGVHSGAEFSWQTTRATDEWNFANLSHVDDG